MPTASVPILCGADRQGAWCCRDFPGSMCALPVADEVFCMCLIRL